MIGRHAGEQVSDGTNSTTFYYDGQMPVEMKDVTSTGSAVTCQVPGARGLDWMQKTTGSGTVVAYPVYDAHGNMIATLSRSGSASYALNDQRSYDAWGGIRSGSTTGDPKHQHCANAGQLRDDESDLTWNHSRYYDCHSGRFLSSDPARSGRNWYFYCTNDPVNRTDIDGREDESLWALAGYGAAILALIGSYSTISEVQSAIPIIAVAVASAIVSLGAGGLAVYCFVRALGSTSSEAKGVISFLVTMAGVPLKAALTQGMAGLSGLTKSLGEIGAAIATTMATWLCTCVAALAIIGSDGE